MIEESQIFSRIITRPEIIANEIPKQGVALVVLSFNNQFLMVQEGHADEQYGRQRGQWNIITETREAEELGVKSTVMRGLKEETDKNWELFSVIDGSYRETNGIYIETMGYSYKYRCCAVLFLGDPDIPANDAFSISEEILDFQWGDWDKLDSYILEVGARLLLEHYGRLFGFLPQESATI